ncbi:MAG TPA: response regulator transcription factor [Pseudonocardia sp.]|jgi:DNA-binding NarL/FixJ family response regulator|uniref:response regulator transcription factor n=1 Tax=Pseudonocardia sp. TaxID=60912 RepID=UPI002F3E59E7
MSEFGTSVLERPATTGYPVLVIDDHELFATSLRMALRMKGFDARQAEVGKFTEVLAQPCPRDGGLVVLDLDLGRDANGNWLSGADLVRGLRAQGWKVLIVSGRVDQSATAVAIAEGALGSVPKSSSFETLLRTVVATAQGRAVMSEAERQAWLARHRSQLVRERAVNQRLGRLSNRERQVLELLAEGLRASAIAEKFVVSMTTVRTQIRSVLTKLEVTSQLEAVALVHQRRRW